MLETTTLISTVTNYESSLNNTLQSYLSDHPVIATADRQTPVSRESCFGDMVTSESSHWCFTQIIRVKVILIPHIT